MFEDIGESDILVQILTCRLSPPARLVSARAQAADAFGDLPLEIVDGFIGDDPEVDRILDVRRAAWFSKRTPTRAETATYATHRKAWEQLVSSPYRAALILEDDFRIIRPDIVTLCLSNDVDLLGFGGDIIKLFDFPRNAAQTQGLWRDVAGLRLVKWKSPRAGLVAYFITREGAERFLSREKIFRAVDEDIKYYWELDLDLWSLQPSPVDEVSNELGGSLLENARDSNWQKRSLVRSLHGIILAAIRKARNNMAYARYHRRFHRGG